MTSQPTRELRRRSIVKTVLWRIIGIMWTWVGAYFIVLLIPPSRKSAALIATLIVAYHHSTRMIMYYFYERIWSSVSWGRTGTMSPMSRKEWALWTIAVLTALVIIIFLIIHVGPRIKAK